MSNLRCIATTSVGEVDSRTREREEGHRNTDSQNSFFKEARWSPDGTCLITNSADNGIRTFVVPSELLDEDKQPHSLAQYSIINSPEPVKAYVTYPGYSLADSSTTLILSSQRDHPTRLSNALGGSKVASYPLINPTTEVFISPHSLHFSPGGSHFVAGSENLISVFDVSRVGNGPISYLPTSPNRGSATMGMKGIVSALDIDESSGLLAAGTFSRHVGLYNDSGQGECVGVFRVEGTDADKHIGGAGITQVKWSLDGQYLYIAERKSDGVMFYDIRKTGQLLGWMVGRNAKTNQRLGFDVVSLDGQTTVWAGGVDGCVRQWVNPQEHEGAVDFERKWQCHNDAVSSIVSHRSGNVLASCSGQRPSEDGAGEFSLKIWSYV